MKSRLQSVIDMERNVNNNDDESKQHYRQVMGDECEHLLTLSNRVVNADEIDGGNWYYIKKISGRCYGIWRKSIS